MLALASLTCTYHVEDRPTWTHPWICLTESQMGDKPALWVWVNEILLDSNNEALILDCCVMPVNRLGNETSVRHGVAVELDQLFGGVAGVRNLQVIFCLHCFSTQYQCG